MALVWAGNKEPQRVLPRPAIKRSMEHAEERPSKFLATEEHAPQEVFGGLTREAYLQKRVHPKLHARASMLSDVELRELGVMDFSKQFTGIEVLCGEAQKSTDLFGGVSRDVYMQQHVHRKLHNQVVNLTDLEILELGRLSFNEQFTVLEPIAADLASHGPAAISQTQSLDLFGGGGRDAFMQQHVHRKLHGKAAGLSDEDLLSLGKLSFNDQFPTLEGVVGVGNVAGVLQRVPDIFGGIGRDAYTATRVHRRLHAQAAHLSDQQLRDLGQLSFNQQFTFLETQPIVHAPRADVFQGVGRDGYMQQRVHRKLHSKAAALPDQELFELGKLSFNEQFPALELVGDAAATAMLHEQSQSPDYFGGMGREAYMATRVHRKLHAQASHLSDQQLHELGQLNFNQQFTSIEGMAVVLQHQQVPQQGPELFAGIGRDGYMQQRVHRKLHARAAALSDQELLELGRLSFNDQFPALERAEPVAVAVPVTLEHAQAQVPVQVPAVPTAPAPGAAEVFGGLGREAYMAQRVHRRLHARAAGLNDEQLLELGRLSFNQQFPALENQPEAAELFPGLGREGYMQCRVHRKLHSRAACLSDHELLELGKLSFNDQFPALEQLIPTADPEPQQRPFF